MTDLTLHHRVPFARRDAPMRPCIWCGQPTPVMAETPFRPDLGALPLMLTCGSLMRDAYRIWEAGAVLPPDYLAGIARLATLSPPALGDGS